MNQYLMDDVQLDYEPAEPYSLTLKEKLKVVFKRRPKSTKLPSGLRERYACGDRTICEAQPE